MTPPPLILADLDDSLFQTRPSKRCSAGWRRAS